MTILNEDLIKQVFNEMVKFRPALAKYLIVDEEEEDDSIDYRVLGDLIIKHYPWPIGVELRRLFSGSMRQLDRARLDQIFKTIERTMQFVSFVMVSQLWEVVEDKKIELPDGFKNTFASRFEELTLGNFATIIRSVGKLFADNRVDWFLPEMKDCLDNKFYNSLDFWVPERNEIGHYQINLTQGEIEKRCVEYEEKLTTFLQKIAFLSKYRLVSVREIQVKKTRNKDAVFHHVINLLNSSDSDFRSQEMDEANFSDSNSVLIMKSTKSVGEFLNLSPLIIDTHSEIIDSKEKFNIKKDIFMYTKFRGDQLMYVGTEITEKCDLRNLSNYSFLVEEYKDMMSHLTGKV